MAEGIRKYISSAPNRAAPGPLGSRFEHWKLQQLAHRLRCEHAPHRVDRRGLVSRVTREDGSINLGGNVCGILRRAEAMLECGALELGDALPPIHI